MPIWLPAGTSLERRPRGGVGCPWHFICTRVPACSLTWGSVGATCGIQPGSPHSRAAHLPFCEKRPWFPSDPSWPASGPHSTSFPTERWLLAVPSSGQNNAGLWPLTRAGAGLPTPWPSASVCAAVPASHTRGFSARKVWGTHPHTLMGCFGLSQTPPAPGQEGTKMWP